MCQALLISYIEGAASERECSSKSIGHARWQQGIFPLRRTIPCDGPGLPDSGYPLGWESARGASRMRPVWHSSRATVAMTGRPAQSGPRSTACFISGASPRRGMHEEREYHERGSTSILATR